MIGTTIGQYRIVGHLGRGGSGTVYHAVDETLGRDVAIKVLNPDLAGSDAIERFRTEATILAKLNHPAIATVYELFRSGSDFLMVMEFVRGETLDSLSHRIGPMAPDRAAHIVDQVLSALGHAHAAGVVHRDMKPANVMVTENGAIKIMDFGIARVRGERAAAALMGTPAYMPPEQVLSHQIDGRADLYAVGVILYRLLTSTLPFTAETPVAVLQRQIADAPTPLQFHREGLPDWCDAIVQRALAKSPDDRFQTAGEFREALARVARIAAPAVDVAVLPAAGETPDASEPHHTSDTQTIVTVDAAASRRRLLYVAAALLPLAAAVVFAVASHRTLSPTEMPIVITPPAPSAAVSTLVLVPPAPSGQPPSSPDAKAPPRRLVFETKALAGNGPKQQALDAKVVLSDDRLDVSADGDPRRLLYSVPYDTVTSITYSHSHDPMWESPVGPALVAHAEGGVLGALWFFREWHWITVRTTKAAFVVLRVGDTQVGEVLAALQERTGVAAYRHGERKRRRES